MDRSRINEDFRANPRRLRTWTLYLIHVRSTWNQCTILEESLYDPRGISVDDPRGYPRNFFQLESLACSLINSENFFLFMQQVSKRRFWARVCGKRHECRPCRHESPIWPQKKIPRGVLLFLDCTERVEGVKSHSVDLVHQVTPMCICITPRDEEGEYTYIGSRGSSVIDYAIVNEEAWMEVEDFVIGDRTESDHQPLEVVVGSERRYEKKKIKGKDEKKVVSSWTEEDIIRFQANIDEELSQRGSGGWMTGSVEDNWKELKEIVDKAVIDLLANTGGRDISALTINILSRVMVDEFEYKFEKKKYDSNDYKPVRLYMSGSHTVCFSSTADCCDLSSSIEQDARTRKFECSCRKCKRWSAPEDRSSPISHSSAPVSRISSPSSSQFTCSTEYSASLASLSLRVKSHQTSLASRGSASPSTQVFTRQSQFTELSSTNGWGASRPLTSNLSFAFFHQTISLSCFSDTAVSSKEISHRVAHAILLRRQLARVFTYIPPDSMNGRLASIEASLLEFSHVQHQHNASIEHNTNTIAGLDGRVTAEIAYHQVRQRSCFYGYVSGDWACLRPVACRRRRRTCGGSRYLRGSRVGHSPLRGRNQQCDSRAHRLCLGAG
ncbi:unnamed protein product [Trichogramma brassicae]|uniref:Endonuclease/exonuclease/phosphatase domain-containing protein n=1 Tax=Trichogramma brassicae TaxID=86971 RepID=A0A6H5IIQ1_9HYME|nr:unnamed protein product [Trichogramma brassicae]